jgi:tetraacyldisaccharide 4'-kinase
LTLPRSRGAWLERTLTRAWLGRGLLARALWPISALAGVLLTRQRARAVPPVPLRVPVLVVGNLIVGGAGKTPTVLAAVDLLRRHGHRPGIVSRGHGRSSDAIGEVTPASSAQAAGDEPLLLRLRAGVPVFVGRQRRAVAEALLAAHPELTVIVSDDGLQHAALPRQAQVIVFDERGVGNGWLLPAGPLREPFTAQPPARSLVLYNAPAPSTPWPGSVARRGLRGAAALADWWDGQPATAAALLALRGRPVWAVAGTARPKRFFDMVDAAGLQATHLPLPDHHDYATLPWPLDAAIDVVLTEKDAVKLRPERVGAARVWVLPLDFELGVAFNAALLALLPPPAPDSSLRTPDGHPTA